MQHYIVPSLHFATQQIAKIANYVQTPKQNPEKPIVKNPVHSIFVDSILMSAVRRVDAEQVILLLLKYLPWKPKYVEMHPNAAIRQIGAIGTKLSNAYSSISKSADPIATVQCIVSNYEDYANCIISGNNRYSYKVLGNVIAKKMKRPIANDQELLTLLRVGKSTLADMLPTKLLYATIHEECVSLLMNGESHHYMIDVQVFQLPDFVKNAVHKYPQIFEYAPASVKNNPTLISHALTIQQPQLLLYCSVETQCKHKIQFLQSLQHNKKHLSTIVHAWADDEHVMKYMVATNGMLYAYATNRVKQIEEVAIRAVHQNMYAYTHQLVPSMQSNLNVIKELLHHGLDNIHFVDDDIVDMYAETRQVRDLIQQHNEALLASNHIISMDHFLQQQGIKLLLRS